MSQIDKDLKILQNNAFGICVYVRLRDMISIERMRKLANLLSLEQRRQNQLLSLIFMFKCRYEHA